MLVVNTDVFDENIAGTSTTWYTSAEFDTVLGDPEELFVMALATNVSGTAAGLNVYWEVSADDRNWAPGAWPVAGTSPILSISPLTEGAMAMGFGLGMVYARMRITLTGTSPGCCLKLSVTGRNID